MPNVEALAMLSDAGKDRVPRCIVDQYSVSRWRVTLTHVTCCCGQLSLTFSQPPVTQLVCHCQDCREVTQQPTTLVAFFKSEPEGMAGQVINKPYMGGSGRPKSYAACAQCGDFLYADVSVLKGLVGVIGDKILPPFRAKPTAHVWTCQRVVEITESLPQFPKAPAVRPGAG